VTASTLDLNVTVGWEEDEGCCARPTQGLLAAIIAVITTPTTECRTTAAPSSMVLPRLMNQ
jgi:hypothetical protein